MGVRCSKNADAAPDDPDAAAAAAAAAPAAAAPAAPAAAAPAAPAAPAAADAAPAAADAALTNYNQTRVLLLLLLPYNLQCTHHLPNWAVPRALHGFHAGIHGVH